MRLLGQTRRPLVNGAVAAALLVAVGCTIDEGSPESDDTTTPAGTEPVAEDLAAMLPDHIVESGKIVVSNPLQNPPYAFLEEDGKTLSGIAPDLSRALEPMLGVEFEWIDTPFPGLIPGLQAGRFDMIWGSITDNVEREEVLDFVDYHMDGALLLVGAGNPEGIAAIEDGCGLTIGALSGSVQIEMLETQSASCQSEGQPAIEIPVYPDVPGGLTAIRSGQADAFFAGVGAARYQADVAPDDFETTGPIYSASPFGAGFNKDDRELTEAIQAGLQALVEDGTYAEILDEYGMGVTALTADQILVNGAEQLGQEILDTDGGSP